MLGISLMRRLLRRRSRHVTGVAIDGVGTAFWNDGMDSDTLGITARDMVMKTTLTECNGIISPSSLCCCKLANVGMCSSCARIYQMADSRQLC